MNVISQVMGPREWSLLMLLGLLWGGSFFFNEVALVGFRPLTAVALRVSLAAAVLWLIALSMGYRVPRDKLSWRRFMLIGLLNNAIPFSLILWGQSHVTSAVASILNATTPLFAVLVAHASLPDEPASVRKIAGVLVGLAGIILMMGAGADMWRSHLSAEIAILLAAFFYAVAGAYGRRFARMTPMVTAAGQVTAAAIFMVPLALIVDQPWSRPPPGQSAWSAVAALAILSTALAYCIYFAVLKAAGATNLMLVTFLVPASAILLGLLFLDERLTATDLGGLAAITAGLVIIDGRILRLWQPRPRL